MCVVATYVIMHVIVYFGVCKCHGCSSHLCKWMFNLVMQACPYKCVCVCVCVCVCCCSVCNPIAQHTRLVKLNRFCSLVSTQTVRPSEPHAVYHTYLHLADRFFCVA